MNLKALNGDSWLFAQATHFLGLIYELVIGVWYGIGVLLEKVLIFRFHQNRLSIFGRIDICMGEGVSPVTISFANIGLHNNS